LISSFGLKGVAVKIKFQINQASRRSISKVDFVYLYKSYYTKSSLRKYCKEGTSIVTHFLIPAKKEEKIQKKNIYSKEYQKNNNSEKRMSKRLENDQKLVKEV
jgi:hypothetical protein